MELTNSLKDMNGSDPELLWLQCRPAATVPIQPLAWEPPHAMGVALEKTKKKKKNPDKKHYKKTIKSLP